MTSDINSRLNTSEELCFISIHRFELKRKYKKKITFGERYFQLQIANSIFQTHDVSCLNKSRLIFRPKPITTYFDLSNNKQYKS